MRLMIAGIPVEIKTEHGFTPRSFNLFETDSEALASVSLPSGWIEKMRSHHTPGMTDALVEYNELPPAVSDALLPFGRCLFHGVAFIWRGKAWLFSAPSGTGKSTQYVLWKIRYGDEIRMLNGDKPVLEFSDNGVTVHPSPWTGKESMGRMESAPLGGIIFLRQAGENRIDLLPAGQAVAPIFGQFIYSAGTEEQIHAVCRMEEQMLRSVPVWLLSNLGDTASAELTHDTLAAYEEAGYDL